MKLVSQLRNSKKAIWMGGCVKKMGGCGKKPVLAIDGNTSRKITPGAVCRTERSTGEGITKYRNSYIYRDII